MFRRKTKQSSAVVLPTVAEIKEVADAKAETLREAERARKTRQDAEEITERARELMRRNGFMAAIEEALGTGYGY